MIISRRPFRSFVLPSAAVALVALVTSSPAAPPTNPAGQAGGDVVVSDKSAAAAASSDPFAVPNGTPEELLNYIEKVAHPQKQFASPVEMRNYFTRASASMSATADKVLAADATDKQLTDAIEWKVESFHVKAELGDENAMKATGDFLAGLKYDNRPALAESLAKIRQNYELTQFQMTLASKLRAWSNLSAAEQSEVINQVGTIVKVGAPTSEKIELLVGITDQIGDDSDEKVIARMLNGIMPAFRASTDPGVIQMLPLLEGIARRFDLPGHKIELTGNYLDGKPLNWEAYRGKVVLVDFWATWCGPCKAEVPNVLENYRKYHDKGFDVLGISLDEERAPVEQYMRQSGVPWQTLFYAIPDEHHRQHPMAMKYGVTGIPRAILVDQQGNVVSTNARGRVLSDELAKLLGGNAAKTGAATGTSDSGKTAQDENR